jgi:hypothetical protein
MKCLHCKKEMLKVSSCVETPVLIKGVEYEQVPYSRGAPGRCRDCNITDGSFHHPGCDNEKCPCCHGQIISCGCLEAPDEDP